MNPTPALIDSSGRRLSLDRQIASGGEGAVFLLATDPDRVAKIYHRPPTPQTVEKLKAMIALGRKELFAVAAWPNEILLDAKTKKLAGFTMPRLNEFEPIQHLYSPAQRLKFFPTAGWNFQIRAAYNLAAAVEEIHKSGCIIGDVNQSNAQVSPQAIVRLIDCDSFQVRVKEKQFLCEVGVPHYTPPELQGKSLRGITRTENHDRFGLAVLIFQLLFVGRHPYSGIYQGKDDPSFEDLIREFRFGQGPLAHTWGMSPPPHTPTFDDLPSDVTNLFRRAFERGSELGNRPLPSEWLAALGALEPNVRDCVRDSGHKYWKNLSECVWCRLARNSGPEYYFGVSGTAGSFEIDEPRIQAVLRRLEQANLPDIPFDPMDFASKTPPQPLPLPEIVEKNIRLLSWPLFGVMLCLVMIPFGLLDAGFFFVGLFGALALGGLWSVLFLRSPWRAELARRRAIRDRHQVELEFWEATWFETVFNCQLEASQLRLSIHELISKCRSLIPEYHLEQKRLSSKAEAAAQERHLRFYPLSDADIPKIGAGRKQVLASHNILTAADIEASKIRAIRGFGESLTANLLEWKQQILKLFQYDRSATVSPAEQRDLTVRFRTRQQQIFAQIDKEIGELESIPAQCRTRLARFTSELKAAVARLQQADADFDLILGRNQPR